MINNINEIDIDILLQRVQIITTKAGDQIKEYFSNTFIEVEYKNNNSPVTIADQHANSIILEGLKKISNFAVLSEESNNSHNFDSEKIFWVVDPLDGTKEFINSIPEFTVNIALIYNKVPILGVILDPISKDMYTAISGKGAFKNGVKVKCDQNRSRPNILVSRSHQSSKTKSFLKCFSNSNIVEMGSSLKCCKIADGTFNIYPRLSPTNVWDIAAAYIICLESGAQFLTSNNSEKFKFNFKNYVNDEFIISSPNFSNECQKIYQIAGNDFN